MLMNQQTGSTDKNGLDAVRQQCAHLILEGLSKFFFFDINFVILLADPRTICLIEQITGTKKIAMNYTNYETAIKEKHGVALIGWPVKGPNDTEGPPFGPPSTITSVALARLLRDSLNNGVCRWKKLSRAELTQFSQELAEKRAAGEQVGKSRKKRSDAGKKRKRGSKDSDDEDEDDDDEDGGGSGTDEELARKKAKLNKRKEETEEERRVRKGRADAAHKAREAEKAVNKAQAALRAAKKAAKKEAGKKRQGKKIRASFAPKSKQVIEDDDDEDDDTGSDDDD